MKKSASLFLKGSLLVCGVFLLAGCQKNEAPNEEAVREQLENLPLSFQENKGQVDEAVEYLVKNGSTTIFFTPEEVVYNMVERVEKNEESEKGKGPNAAREDDEIRNVVVRQSFIGANKAPEISSSEQQQGTVNYMIGNDPSKWVKGASTYGKIRYEELYSGIDLEYSGEKSALKYAFMVSPGTDYQQISVKLTGIDSLEIDGEGNLVMKNDFGNLLLEKPFTFQEVDGKQQEVASSYKITSQDTYAFEVAEYDPSLPLIIDPRFVWASYWGRSGNADEIHGIDVDDDGNVYVAGRTNSTAWTCSPACAGYDSSHNGSTDVFVTKFNENATNPVIYFTYLGGAGADLVYDIAVNSAGEAYVAGQAPSGYPFIIGAYDTVINGNDGFISQLSDDGTQLLASTYFGGQNTDTIMAIEVDGTGNVYVAGETSNTESSTPPFPLISSYDATANGGTEAFYAKFDDDLSTLLISSFIGGSSSDRVYGIDVDTTGRIYLAGETASSDFPLFNAYQAVDTGGNDAFIARISSGGTALQYSSYLGAAGTDIAYDVATTDAGGVAAITGSTTSAVFNTKNPLDSTLGGSQDGFVALFDTSSSGAGSLIYSTYLGGSSTENLRAVDIDSDENVYVFGESSSSDYPLTTDTAVQTVYGTGSDFVLSKINDLGDELLYSTYVSRTSFGGNSTDIGYALVVNDEGRAYGAGVTSSTGMSTTGVVQTVRSTATDGYFFQISTVNEAPLEPVLRSPLNGSTIFNVTPTLVAQFSDNDVNEEGTIDFRVSSGSAQNCLDGASLVASGTSSSVSGGFNASFYVSTPLSHGNTYQWCARNEDDEGLQSNNNAFTTMGSFTIDSNDPTFRLGGYLGGSSGNTIPVAVGLDTSGNVVMVGQTESTDFPTVNPIQASPNVVGQNSIFVTKFNPSLSSIIVSTYLQGNFEDYVRGGGVDASGNVYVTGISYSTTTFTDHPPVNAGFDMTPDSSTGDIYLVKFNEAVDTILYATYLGGSDYEDQYWTSTHIAPNGMAYIVGATFSTDFELKNAFDSQGDTNFNGDAFAAKIDTTQSGANSLIYSTYIGGDNPDDYEDAWGVTADDDGNTYVVGYQYGAGFPAITSGAFKTTPELNGGDAYLVKIDPDGDLLYGTFLGGTEADTAHSVAIGPLSTVYLCGITASTDLLTTPNAFDSTYNGGSNDGFVYRMALNGNGTSDLLYGTYIGGTGNDWCGYSSVNSRGSFFFQGLASSGFPTTLDAFSSTLNGTEDQTVVKLHPGNNGSSDLVYSSYFGGSGTQEQDQGVYLDSIDFYMVGQTNSFDFPTSSGGIYSAKPSTSSTNFVGYLTKFEFDLPSNNAPTAPTNLFVGDTTAQSGSANPTGITDTTPAFSAICTDPNAGDILGKYRIQVDNNNDFSSPVWDSGASGTEMVGGCVEGDRSQDFDFGGTPLALDGTTYYWRIKFWDLADDEGVYSATNTFTMGAGYHEFSTYLGGGLDDLTYGIGLDASGNIVVMGSTYSSDFPTENALQGTFAGEQDAFIVKMTDDGSDVLISTYFGASSSHDPLRAARVDSSGNVYLLGATTSNNLFTTHSPNISGFDMSFNGDVDGYLAKLDPTLSDVLYGTYFGGTGNEEFSWKTLRVDNSGMAYIAGGTSSTDFPVTANAFDATGDATNRDGFVMKIDTTVSGSGSLIYSSYVGGVSGEERMFGVSFDTAGNIYVAGEAYSSDFAALALTAGAFKTTFDFTNGDGFVLKIDPSQVVAQDTLVYGTAIGGDDNYDGAYDVIPLSSGNNVYVCGGTYASDLATTAGSFDQTLEGGGSSGDIFLYELSLDSSGANDLVYGTYAGGVGDDWCGELNEGSMIFYGSSGDGFPTTDDAYMQNAAGGYDLIVGRLDPAGNGSDDLIYASYFGGTQDEFDYGTYLDGDTLYMSGSTASTDFPVADGYFSTTNAGQLDGFGFSMTIPDAGAAAPDAIVNLNATAGNAQVSLTWSAPADNGSAITDYIVEYGETSGFPGNAQVFSDGTSASTGATVTGLVNGTDYSFRVAAVNGVGQGPYSNVDNATPALGAAPQNETEAEITIDINDFLSFSIENLAAGDEAAGDQPFGAGALITDLTSSGANDYAISGSFGSPVFTRLRTNTNSNDGYSVSAYAATTGGRTNTLLRSGGAGGNAADEIEDTLTRLSASQAANDTLDTASDTGLAFRLHDANTTALLRESDEDTQWGDNDTSNALWAAFPLGSGAAQVIYDTMNYSEVATTAYINWFVGIDPAQRSGSYSGQVTFTASVN